MSTQRNISAVKRLFDEVYTKGKVKVCDELAAADLVMHDPSLPDDLEGLEAFKERELMFQSAFKGKKAVIEDILAADDKVVARWRVTGKQTGDLPNLAATGKSIDITGILIYRFADGKIAEIWQNWDELRLYEQLGALRVPEKVG